MILPSAADWTYPTRLWFGPGRLADVGLACREVGLKRPLVVIDAGLTALPVAAAIQTNLGGSDLEFGVFSSFRPNPDDQDLASGLAAFRDGEHDGIVAVGGGSALDIGKAIAFMSAQRRPIWDFEDIGDWWKRAEAGMIPPIIAVPTTAGTGSEVGRAVVITQSGTGQKKIIFHPSMMPVISIIDPALATTLPVQITVGTGFDALSHCIEALCVPRFHSLADGIAIEGARLIMGNLAAAAAWPGDLRARTALALGSVHGGTAFQKGLGAVHALSHPIGSRFHTHHGMTNAVLLPYVLLHNRLAIAEKITRVAAACGLGHSFDAFLDAVLELRFNLGVPNTLAQLDRCIAIDGDLIAAALADPTAPGNPVKLDAQNLTAMAAWAMAGECTRV